MSSSLSFNDQLMMDALKAQLQLRQSDGVKEGLLKSPESLASCVGRYFDLGPQAIVMYSLEEPALLQNRRVILALASDLGFSNLDHSILYEVVHSVVELANWSMDAFIQEEGEEQEKCWLRVVEFLNSDDCPDEITTAVNSIILPQLSGRGQFQCGQVAEDRGDLKDALAQFQIAGQHFDKLYTNLWNSRQDLRDAKMDDGRFDHVMNSCGESLKKVNVAYERVSELLG